MAISISNALPASPELTPQDRPKVEGQGSMVARVATDTVKLSQSAQIHALRQQGQRPSQIASSLGVSVSSVDSVLGITVAKAAAPAPVVVQAAPAPAPGLPVAKG
jgi:DNA-binding CsgD family transcriptional regulator